MLPHELVHDHAVQLLLLVPLGQREAIPAGNVGLNYCGVLPILSNELASLPRIEYRNPGLPCLLLNKDQR
jgi:hypothetical protein